MENSRVIATDIRVRRASRVLEISFADGSSHALPFEYLRVYSPSAEVRGHGAGQAVLQTGKRDIDVTAVEAVGRYAVKLSFSDGHDSGLYSWSYLHELALRHEELWQAYLTQLKQAGASRDA